MSTEAKKYFYRLLGFSVLISLVSYGFTLANPSLSIDSETPIGADFALSLGRWGTTLVRYYIFHGHLPYFTLLLGLIFIALASVELAKLFSLKGVYGYLFCALFISFPQLAYQLLFTMQADIIGIGFFLSTLVITLYLKSFDFSIQKKLAYLGLSAFVMMLVIALYQALFLIPLVIFLIVFLTKTFAPDFKLKNEIQPTLYFGAVIIFSLLLYYISTKLFCPPAPQGLLSSYRTGNSPNQLSTAYDIWIENLKGNWYYGEKTFLLASVVSVLLLIKFIILKSNILIRILVLFLLLIIPFGFTFFITNGYHPPRIYITSGFVFSFLIVFFIRYLKFPKVEILLTGLICLINIYFITNLFYSNYKILNHDKELAKEIDSKIKAQYSDFDENINYVYFHGCVPFEHHQKLRLEKSEAFGGSHFSWDNGDNYRIINFFNYNDIAYYKMIDNIDLYTNIKDSIDQLPVWPKEGSVKKINNVVVVKLGNQKGAKLFVEY